MSDWNCLREKWAQLGNDYELDDGLLLVQGPGHTRKVANCTCVHEGRETSWFYTAGTYLQVLEEPTQLTILHALAALQNRDPSSRFCGGFRWFSEEEEIEDTNGAFFLTMPLLQLWLYQKDKIPQSNLPVLREIFTHALVWFRRECEHPSNYYPNKVLSDGAALCALANCLEDETARQEALTFVAQWEQYTQTRGWGWGENISPVYSEVMLDALHVMLHVLRLWKHPLAQSIQARYAQIKDIVAFHAPCEFIPAIRSYNFAGADTYPLAMLHYKAGLDHDLTTRIQAVQGKKTNLTQTAICAFLYAENAVEHASSAAPVQNTAANAQESTENTERQSVRTEHIFDGCYATTWKGRNVRLGSLNAFPVMPGCYHHPGWGLGWQSMPVSFLVHGAQTGYLRFGVQDGSSLRTHPAHDLHTAYLHSGLFAEQSLPAVRTHCTQHKNILVATRTIERLHNTAQRIEDAWVVHNFHGAVAEIDGWTCLIYDTCSLGIRCMGGCTADGLDIGCARSEAVQDGDTLLIRKVLYEGEKKLLEIERLECQWAVLAFDNITDAAALAQALGAYSLTDQFVPDYDIPRDSTWLEKTWNARVTQVLCNGKPVLTHRFDPFCAFAPNQ